MLIHPKLFGIFFLFGCITAKTQENSLTHDSVPPNLKSKLYKSLYNSDLNEDTYRSLCVPLSDYYHFFTSTENKIVVNNTIKASKPFLTIHGNVMYDYYYQSYLDTPYSGSELQQHTISTYFDILVKDAYPLKLSFTTRLGNNIYLKNFSAMNLSFDQNSFASGIQQKAKAWAAQRFYPDTSKLHELRETLEQKNKQLSDAKSWLFSPSVLQHIIDEREKKLGDSTNKVYTSYTDSISNSYSSNFTSLNNKREGFAWLKQKVSLERTARKKDEENSSSVEEKYFQEKQTVDSLEKKVDSLQLAYNHEKYVFDSLRKAAVSEVAGLRDKTKWKSGLKKITNADSVLPKGYETLLAIKKLNIGTSTVNYSELSAKDITITGAQIEYNPKLYYAIAGGVINYRFRDYLLPQPSGPSQYLGLIRFGKQNSESDNLVFTYYFGRKRLYNYFPTDSLTNSTTIPNYSLMGITLEKRVSLTKNICLSAEIAKSTIPYYNRPNHQGNTISGAFDFSNRSNEAYAIKANAVFTQTRTRLDGYFKHFGENFQSFTLFSTNTRQTAWLLHTEQPFFKSQLLINASLRKNDYVDPFINQRYVSNIIFKSVQALLRLRKMPVLTLGYYPTSQLTKIADNHYVENLFYTLVGSVSYYYKLGDVRMSSTGLVTKFYNKPLDSGYLYYNSNNYIIDHSIIFKNVTFTAGFNKSVNISYSLNSFSSGFQWKTKKWLLVGASLKYNQQNSVDQSVIGYSANTTLLIPALGSLQLKIQKAYLPGPNYHLVSDNIGRFTFFRNF